jgi:hypothetical protein
MPVGLRCGPCARFTGRACSFGPTSSEKYSRGVMQTGNRKFGSYADRPKHCWVDALDTVGVHDFFRDVQPLVFPELSSDSEVPP